MKTIVYVLSRLCLIVTGTIAICGLTGCCGCEETYPYIQYQYSAWDMDTHNRLIDIPESYILSDNHPYDIVETEEGCDIILHMVKEEE